MLRRTFVTGAAAVAACGAGPKARSILTRAIPSSGEEIPAIGMGSWLTFDVGENDLTARRDVLSTFLGAGGCVVDSSPMYGGSQGVIGRCLKSLGKSDAVFAADKIWTPGGEDGGAQISRSRARWSVPRFRLLQVHNLVGWRRHLPVLFEMKAEGAIDYVGVTTYAGLRHDEIESIILSEPVDFIQLTYNIADQEAQSRRLPLARDRGVAVIANRPFREGALTEIVRGRRVPGFAAEFGAATWPQAMLKFIVSHPAITCVIPATRRVDHMRENMAALSGPLPDEAMRLRLAEAFKAL